MSTLLVMQAVLVATVAIGFSGAILAWRERPEPGSVSLTLFLAGACWWSASLLFQVGAETLSAKVFWVNLSWIGVAVIPVAWLFFCLAYTGYSDYLNLRYVAIVSLVPAVTVVLALTNDAHHLLYANSTLVDRGGTVVLSREPGVWFWIIAGYTYLLGLLGAVPLLQFVSSEVGTFRGQSLALLVGLATPWVVNILYLMEMLPTGGVDPTPVGFSISAVAFLGALTRFQLLDTSPAPIRPARRAMFDRMDGGVIVLDRRQNVVDLNQQAASALGRRPGDLLGRSLESVSPQFEGLLGAGSRSEGTVFQPGDGNRSYEASIADLTDTHGRVIGYIVTMQDISEYLRQQQRLEVLNRVFRHNIRTNTQVIVGHVEYLANNDSEERATEAQERAMEITAFGDKIRSVLDVFERGRTETTPIKLRRILEESVAEVRREFPSVTVHTREWPTDVYVDHIAHDILANAIENAAQHNTNPEPAVWVDAETGDGGVRVTVSDNGPGINEEELALLRNGSETPLEHGTGLGLALIVWGTDLIDGRVSVEDRTEGGTTLTVEIPVIRAAEPTDIA